MTPLEIAVVSWPLVLWALRQFWKLGRAEHRDSTTISPTTMTELSRAGRLQAPEGESARDPSPAG